MAAERGKDTTKFDTAATPMFTTSRLFSPKALALNVRCEPVVLVVVIAADALMSMSPTENNCPTGCAKANVIDPPKPKSSESLVLAS